MSDDYVFEDRADRLEGEVRELTSRLEDAEKELDDYMGYMDRLDATICDTIEAVGGDPCRGLGMAYRVDEICKLARRMHAGATTPAPIPCKYCGGRGVIEFEKAACVHESWVECSRCHGKGTL